MTKTALDEKNATQFVAGDQFMLYAWDGTLSATNTPWINGVNVTLGTDNKWVPASQILWKTEQTSHDFLAIYPSSIISTGADLSAVSYTLNDAGAVIAHDLRSPMASIRMVLNLVVQTVSPEAIGPEMFYLIDKAVFFKKVVPLRLIWIF